jgi:hypothetical protein
MSEESLSLGNSNFQNLDNATLKKCAVARVEFRRLIWADSRIKSLCRQYAERMQISKELFRQAVQELDRLAFARGYKNRSDLTGDDYCSGLPLKTEAFWQFFTLQLTNVSKMADFENDVEDFVSQKLGLDSRYVWTRRDLIRDVPTTLAVSLSGKEFDSISDVVPSRLMPEKNLPQPNDTETDREYEIRWRKEFNRIKAARDGRMPTDFSDTKRNVGWFFDVNCREPRMKIVDLIERSPLKISHQKIRYGINEAENLLTLPDNFKQN